MSYNFLRDCYNKKLLLLYNAHTVRPSNMEIPGISKNEIMNKTSKQYIPWTKIRLV